MVFHGAIKIDGYGLQIRVHIYGAISRNHRDNFGNFFHFHGILVKKGNDPGEEGIQGRIFFSLGLILSH
jgi:hypothetical protein